MHGRWGIFGGLFDPVHLGHIQLATSLAHEAGLDGVLWVPSASPPHKDRNQPASFHHRVSMLVLAVKSLSNMEISEIELEQELSGYALHTVRALKKRYPKTDFSFIIGADNVSDILNWYQYDQLLSEIDVIAGSRGGVEPVSALVSDSRIRIIEVESLQAASSDIRSLIHAGADSRKLLAFLSQEVYDYVSVNGLYK